MDIECNLSSLKFNGHLIFRKWKIVKPGWPPKKIYEVINFVSKHIFECFKLFVRVFTQ